MTLGQKIRVLRQSKGLGLREFARMLHKTAAFVSDFELGHRNPSDDVLQEIATILQTSFDELKKLDTRAPIDEIKKLAAENPKFGFAFRRMIEENVTPEELLDLAKKKGNR
jgi:transcriptional regulator with XRE-family HTH domain